jgi:hypothetical protein
MAVDYNKEPHILAVHGVQTGEDSQISSGDSIRKLVTKSLNNSNLDRNFDVPGFFYEDINDDAQKYYKALASAITRGKPLVGKGLKSIIDVSGDVVTAAKNTSTAKKIRNKLRKQILDSYTNGHRLVVVAHSLGTIYALDVINELLRNDEYFLGDDRSTWPVHGLLTMGSPLGLDLQIAGMEIFEKRKIEPLKNANFEVFPWHNYFNRLDPVVSGNIFGKPIKISGSNGPVEKRYGADTNACNWLLRGHAVASGDAWIKAHTAYWKKPKIGDQIVSMLWG